MRFFGTVAVILLLISSTFAAAVAGQVQVFAQVDKQGDIYAGESFGYYIVIEGSDTPGEVDLSALSRYNPRSAGNRTSTTIVNGQVSKSYIMSYLLTAAQPGRIVLDSVTVTVDGQQYKTNRLAVDILRPGETESMDLEVKLSQERCYVGQPVLMEVNFYISADIYSAGNIVNPEFSIPAFGNDAFYVDDPDVFDRPVEQRSLGGGLNVYLSQGRSVHKGKDCVVISFSKILIPKYAGAIEIGASSVSAGLAVGRRRSSSLLWGSQLEYKRFMVNTEPISLIVMDLPGTARPAEFYGLAGRYTITASAEPTEAAVGDPVTLTIKIGGGRYLRAIKWPELENVKELAENFKIPAEKASPVIENRFKVFTQTIRANNDKVKAIPSIPLAFADPDKGDFVVAKSEPIELNITPTKILTNADLEGREFSPLNREVEAIRKGLSANYEGPDVLVDESFSLLSAAFSIGYLPIWAVPFAALFLSVLVRGFTYTTPEKIVRKRVRTAGARAVRSLKRITSAGMDKRHEMLAAVMKDYVGERFGRVSRSLTAGECCEIISEATGDETIAAGYGDIIENCESARYASADVNIGGGEVKEAIKLINAIEKKSKK